MTIAKAKLYKTAIIAHDIDEYRKGDIVSVTFIGKGAFGLRFRIEASYLNRPTICVGDSDLTNFVL